MKLLSKFSTFLFLLIWMFFFDNSQTSSFQIYPLYSIIPPFTRIPDPFRNSIIRNSQPLMTSSPSSSNGFYLQQPDKEKRKEEREKRKHKYDHFSIAKKEQQEKEEKLIRQSSHFALSEKDFLPKDLKKLKNAGITLNDLRDRLKNPAMVGSRHQQQEKRSTEAEKPRIRKTTIPVELTEEDEVELKKGNDRGMVESNSFKKDLKQQLEMKKEKIKVNEVEEEDAEPQEKLGKRRRLLRNLPIRTKSKETEKGKSKADKDDKLDDDETFRKLDKDDLTMIVKRNLEEMNRMNPLNPNTFGYHEIGQVIGPHGLQGELKIKIQCDEETIQHLIKKKSHQEEVIYLKHPQRRSPRPIPLLSLKKHKDKEYLMKLKKVNNRDLAILFKKYSVFIYKKQLPSLSENTFYLQDLKGLYCYPCDDNLNILDYQPFGMVNYVFTPEEICDNKDISHLMHSLMEVKLFPPHSIKFLMDNAEMYPELNLTRWKNTTTIPNSISSNIHVLCLLPLVTPIVKKIDPELKVVLVNPPPHAFESSYVEVKRVVLRGFLPARITRLTDEMRAELQLDSLRRTAQIESLPSLPSEISSGGIKDSRTNKDQYIQIKT